MEIRRVQMTGGSSYIITLPKDWIKKLNIQKNDPIGLFRQSDGNLLITPKIDREQIQRIKEFNINDKTSQDLLLRSLIGAYIAGYNSIKLKSKDRITPASRVTLRNFTQNTIGQEVVEETNESILIKDLLNPAEMPFNRTIKRMHIIVKGMFEDAILSLKNKNIDLTRDVLTRDNEIDRLHWLVARQYNTILHNINFAEKMGTTVEIATTSFLISKIIERIGDHVNKIAHYIINIIDKKIAQNILNKIESASDLSLNIFTKSIGAFFIKNLKEANQNIERVKELTKICDEINTLSLKLESEYTISLGYIIESIRRIGEYAEDISEHVINYLVREDK